MIDFHTHILPGIDDGSSSVDESLEMLKRLDKQGVNKAVLTPHFYAYKTDVEMFLEMRNDALRSLKTHDEISDIEVAMFLGCEVLYFDELWRIDNLEKLCITGTEYILIEMPFDSWSESVLQGIERIINRRLIPIIAHFDRYITYQKNSSNIKALFDMGAILQMNVESLKSFSTRHRVLKYLKKGMVGVIGSDCHNMEFRPPDFDVAEKELGKLSGGKYIASIENLSEMILHNAEIIL